MSTLAEVAEMAGVSLATASRVVNDSEYPVSEEARRKVLTAAEQLDFAPNLVARSLVSQRTGTVGVIVHDMTDSYFAEIARGIEDVAQVHDYAALICNSDRDAQKELQYVRKLRAMRVEGIIFTGGGITGGPHGRMIDRQVAAVEAYGGVVVRLAPHPRMRPDICYSNYAGFRLLVDHLYELGHRCIAALCGPARLATNTERRRAFQEALRGAGLAVHPELMVEGAFTREGAEQAVDELLREGAGFTAVCAFNDQMAIGALKALHTRGIRVPEDVSVVGFDDIQLCEYVTPALTTVRVPLYRLGAEGMRMALRLLDGGPRPTERLNLPLSLVVRESTGPAPEPRRAGRRHL